MDEEEKLHEDYKAAEEVCKELKKSYPGDLVFKKIQPLGILDVVRVFRECKKKVVTQRLLKEAYSRPKNNIMASNQS